MGDDIDAPHEMEFAVPDGTSIEWIIKNHISSGYLPLIDGGHATWSVFSNIPIAIIAQEWSEPKMFFVASLDQLDIQDGKLNIYVNYHAQTDPDSVYRMFWGFQNKVG